MRALPDLPRLRMGGMRGLSPIIQEDRMQEDRKDERPDGRPRCRRCGRILPEDSPIGLCGDCFFDEESAMWRPWEGEDVWVLE